MRLTYMIGGDGRWIMCLDCGRISFNSGDVQQRYCGHCHEFHDDKEMKIWSSEYATEADD